MAAPIIFVFAAQKREKGECGAAQRSDAAYDATVKGEKIAGGFGREIFVSGRSS